MATTFLNGKTDLGNAPEMFAAYAELGRLSPDDSYGHVHGSLRAAMDGEAYAAEDIALVRSQAGAFRKRFAGKMSANADGLLATLAEAT